MTASKDYQLFWGDLHCHVREVRRQRDSSGARGAPGPFTLDEVYDFGQHATGLDFVAVTDHDVNLDASEWAETQETAARRTVPGRFVAFTGYEWSHVVGGPSVRYGHRNVIYRNVSGPLLGCQTTGTDTAPGLWVALRDLVAVEDCLVVPHHPARAAGGVWWNLDCFAPDLERLVEVYSLWGSSEKAGPPYEIEYLREQSPTGAGEAPGHFVQDALARGYRFGLVAGSEAHDGRPGNPLYHGPYRCGEAVCYRGGIQGTWAEALERGALFDAFRARRCYGTTGAKIALRFTVNGAWMGEETAAAAERDVHVQVEGTAPLSRVDLVRNNEDWQTVRPEAVVYEGHWLDRPETGTPDYYYVRVTQSDGHMAWSSPVWVGSSTGR